jgi:hypothetical protein
MTEMKTKLKRRSVTYDQMCADLAQHFLSDVAHATNDDVCTLAETIQKVCEDGCEGVEARQRLASKP